MVFRRGIDSRPFSNEFSPELIVPQLETIRLEKAEWEVVGVDISYWQGNIDFSVMRNLVDFVVMRYAYGNSTIDANLSKYYKGASDNNIATMAYHYLKAGKSWATHAETSTSLLRDYPALYLWGDAEESGGLAKSDLESWFYKYFNKVLELTNGSWETPTVGVYTSPNFWNTYLPRTDWAKKLKIWNAHWTTYPVPILPFDWSVPGKPWTLWQYSSKGNGKLYGVSSTYIDLNRYWGSVNDFNNEFSASIKPKPEPEEEYMKVRSLYDYLRVRNDHNTSATVKDYMMSGDTTEALEEFLSGSDKWIRIGFKQWCAMTYAGKNYLEYVV